MVRGAVLYNFNEPLTVDSLELKPPRADEVVVKVAASGVCHSDLSVQQMKLPLPPPVVLGHEGAGVIEEVGKDVTTLKKRSEERRVGKEWRTRRSTEHEKEK